MSESCTHNCNSCGVDCSAKTAGKTDFAEPMNSLSNVKKVIAIMSGKGGVGKSFITGLLAVKELRKGKKIAILDADITGPSIPRMFGVNGEIGGCEQGMFPLKSEKGVSIMSANLLLDNESAPIIWRGSLIAGTVKQFWSGVVWGDIDTMFIDMPPGTGDVPLTVFQSLPVNGIVIVTTPQDLVEMIVAKAVNMASLMNIPVLGLVENMAYTVCPDCGKKIELYGKSNAIETSAEFGIPLLGSLPIMSNCSALCDIGKIEDIPQEICNMVEVKISE